MKYLYKTNGVCCRDIYFEIEDKKIKNVMFTGGCDGNLKAVARLSENLDALNLVNMLRGNKCGTKETSCADQLSKAVSIALKKESEDRHDEINEI